MTRKVAILALRWLITGLVAYAAVLSLTAATSAATPAPTSRAEHRVASAAAASDQRRKRLGAQLVAAVRDFRHLADEVVHDPTPINRIGFTTEKFLMDALIREVRAVGGLARQASIAQLVVERETRRVYRAWGEVDKKAEVAVVVHQVEGVAFDAARASGARTADEINAFKKAHLADIRYASRRWLVDREIGRQGAVFIARGARNPRLRNAIEQMYRRPASIGDGGTADALLAEVRAGCTGPACKHFLKAIGYRRNLVKIRRQERLSATEIGITDELVGALTKAIRAAGAT